MAARGVKQPKIKEVAAAPPAKGKDKKVSPKSDGEGGGKKAKREYTFKSYIFKVLKQVHPDTGLTADTSSALDRIVTELIVKISREMMTLVNANKKVTLTSHEVQTAIRLILPGELAKHAVSEGTKAITKFNAWVSGAAEAPKKKGEKRKGTSRSARAGLVFPVKRIEHHIRINTGNLRVGVGAPVYLAAVLEYLVAEMLELAGNASRDNRKVRITPRHLKLAIDNDEELVKLLKGFVLGGGVVPNPRDYENPEDAKKREQGL